MAVSVKTILFGGTGNDTILAADGRVDQVDCGLGDNDTAYVDELDEPVDELRKRLPGCSRGDLVEASRKERKTKGRPRGAIAQSRGLRLLPPPCGSAKGRISGSSGKIFLLEEPEKAPFGRDRSGACRSRCILCSSRRTHVRHRGPCGPPTPTGDTPTARSLVALWDQAHSGGDHSILQTTVIRARSMTFAPSAATSMRSSSTVGAFAQSLIQTRGLGRMFRS